MATMNPFDLLGDDDAEDPSLLIAAQQQKVAAAAAPKKSQSQPQAKQAAQSLFQAKQPAKLPTKPAPPAQAVWEARNETGRGGGRGTGHGSYGRGRGGYNRDSSNDTGAPVAQGASEDGDSGRASERCSYGGPHGGFRGGRRGGFTNGEVGHGERPRRQFDRLSGTGQGNEIKRYGAGRGNWGTPSDELAQVTEETVNEGGKVLGDEKPAGEGEASDANNESPANEPEEKESEDKEMTLEEYEKVREEKRKALQAFMTSAERKVDSGEFKSMQQLSSKKGGDDFFIKLGSDKDKRKEALEKDEKAKKSVSINEFLKPAEGERYYGPGRGRGRGRGSRGGFGNREVVSNVAAPSIEDPGQFPTLGGK